jgi:hypothetical protein
MPLGKNIFLCTLCDPIPAHAGNLAFGRLKNLNIHAKLRIMKEFMLRILNKSDHQLAWTLERHQQFLKRCEKYIGELKKKGQLISAQPLVREGKMISGVAGSWKETPLRETGEVQVGYYQIFANDLDEAVEIAKQNPEFEYSTTARIEVRPIKTEEKTTGFVYPKTV